MTRMEYVWACLLGLLSACAGYALYRSGVLGLSTDDFMRICLAAQWADRPRLVQFGAWPPLFSVFYGSFIRLIPFPLQVGHILTAILSGTVVFLTAVFARIVFRSTSIAVLSAVLVTLNPLHLALAASTLSEPLFSALFWAFLLCAWKWSVGRKASWLVSATFFCILMTTLRADGTPIALLFGLWVIGSLRSWKSLVILPVLLAFPLFWAHVLSREFAPLLVFLKVHSEDSRRFYTSVPGWNLIPYLALPKYCAFGTVSAGCALLFRKRMNNSGRAFLAIALACTVSQLSLLWNHVPAMFPERTVYLVGMQFTILGAFGFCTLWKSKPRMRSLLVLGFILYVGWSLYVGMNMKTEYSEEMVRAGRTIASLPSLASKIHDQRIATDLEDARYGVVAVLSGFPGRFTRLRFEQASNQFFVKDSEPIPRYFLISSEQVARQIRIAWKKSYGVKLHSLWFISDDAEVLAELKGKI